MNFFINLFIFAYICRGNAVASELKTQRRQPNYLEDVVSGRPSTLSVETKVSTSTATSTTSAIPTDSCTDIDNIFRNVSGSDGAPACRCLPDSLGALYEDISINNDEKSTVWIGCTRQNMPSVFRSLSALPSGTIISRLWIWNSLINILPNDMFAKVRPRVLAIENSGLSVFRKGAFSSIGKRLQVLSLKNNILKSIGRKTFSDLDSLQSLDLSGNKLNELQKYQFDDLKLLKDLQLSNNQIVSIEDGSFDSLTNLKTLNLQNNKIVNITKNTFRGLTNLETLNLNGNNISHIEKEAFLHMKRLKMLNLGSNKIFQLELRSLTELEHLYLNNNSIADLQRVSLQDLLHLRTLSLDRNAITRLADNDFSLLARGGDGAQLATLSLAENNISEIGCRTFKNLPRLGVLSLQHNRIKTLLCPKTILVESVLRPLQNLRKLFLSGNVISAVDDGDVNVLSNLKELALDHNQIQSISQHAFKGLNLTKLFLNKNRLYYLPEGLFDSWDKKSIKAVDLSDNPRECICDREWVDIWLRDLGHVNAGSFGCMSRCGDRTAADQRNGTSASGMTPDGFEGHSFWITIIAGVLAVVALIFLVAASYIYMQANCYPIMPSRGLSLGNLPSDMIRLIPSQESLLSFPNPLAVANGPNGPELLLKPSMVPKPLSTISINIDARNTPVGMTTADSTTNNGPATNGTEKKRVRFNDGV